MAADSDWRPVCDIEQLQARAMLLAEIRRFFAQRGVMEVETPLLSQAIGTDPSLAFFKTDYLFGKHPRSLYLQTSPEFAMKRLLAAGSGSVYQMCKAFRNGESGRLHNPEFTLLEWYRTGFTLQDLMTEVCQLLQSLAGGQTAFQHIERVSYQAIFQRFTGLDPLVMELDQYQQFALANRLPDAVTVCGEDHSVWLDYVFSFIVQPQLGDNGITLVYDYPAIHSSLARISVQNPLVTERFEVFVQGVELANGYYELADEAEQNARFEKEQAIREHNGQPVGPKDQLLLAALASGLPDCCGVALGIDRLLMILNNSDSLEEVIAFPIGHA